MPTFDPNATSTPLQPGQNISDDTSTLYAMLGLSATEGAASVLKARGKPKTPAELTPHDVVGSGSLASPDTKTTLGQAIQEFYALDPLQRSQVQRRLLSGGFYSSTNNLLVGRPDDDTVRAYAAAAKQAVIGGKTLDETIDGAAGAVKDDDVNNLLSNGGPGATGAAGKAPFSPVVTNPLDVRDTAQVVATKTLGRKFSDDELNRFVSVYQQMETGAQRQDYAAQTAGGSTTKQPSIAAAAEAQARNVAPVEAGAHDIVGAFDMFTQMLGGGQG